MTARSIWGPILLAAAALLAPPAMADTAGPPRSAAAQAALAEADRIEQEGVVAYRAGDFRTAAPLFRQVWDLRRKVQGERAVGTMNSLNNYVTMLYKAGDFATAEPLAAQCLALRREVLGDRDPDVLESMNVQAGIYLAMGRLAEAEPIFAEALRLQTEIQGEKNPDRIQALNNYAYTLMQLGRAQQAEPLFKQALALRREVLGDDNPDTVLSLNNYAALLIQLGRPQEAKPLFAEAVQRGTTLQGPRHPETIQAKNNYAYAVLETDGARPAEPLFAEVLTLEREVLGEDNPATLQGLNNYGGTLLALGRLSDAEPIMAEAMRQRKKLLGERHPDTLQSVNNYGFLLLELGKPEQAEPYVAEALRLRREVLGPKHPDTLESLGNYGGTLRALGRTAEAEPLLAEALRLRREVEGENHPSTIKALADEAAILLELGRGDEAGPMLRDVVARWQQVIGPDKPETLQAMNNYAGYLADAGKYGEAEPILAQAVAASRRVLGDRHPDTLRRIQNEATVLALLGRGGEADKLYQEVLAARRAQFGDADRDTIQSALGLAYTRMVSTDRRALALEPARLAVAGQRQLLAAGVEDATSDTVVAARDKDRSDAYALFASAAWERGPGLSDKARKSGLKPLAPADEAALEQDVLLALQDALTNVTSRAVARNAALRAAERAGLGKEAAEREALVVQRQALDAQVAAAYAASGPQADEKRKGLEADRAALDSRIGAIDALLKAKAPDYYALTRPAALNLAAAKALLAPDEAWLIIAPTLAGTQVMLVSDEGIRWTVSPMGREEVEKAVRRLQWDVGGDVTVTAEEAAKWGEEGEGETPYDFQTAYALYHALIEPIAAGLEGKKHLFVSPAGAMSSLPLGILVTELPQGANGDPATLRSAKWFADRIAISVVPSLQSLQFIRQYRASSGEAAPAKPYIGFGDPVLEGQAQQRGGGRGSGAKVAGDFRRVFGEGAARGGETVLASAAELRKLARLPQTKVEIENQWQAFGRPPQSVFLEASATETQVKQTRLSAGVLSFATHGLLAGEIRGAAEPGLVLTPPAKATDIDDGFLTSSEIAGLKIDAGWVILSACNTAAGDGSEGAPGLSGLSRAFFFAGATNLLVSHWPVRDDVAARLTVRTIEIARDNPDLSRDEALQKAMKEIRDNAGHDGPGDSWAHPSAWAPFSLVGDGAR